jgi:hypothetical protein
VFGNDIIYSSTSQVVHIESFIPRSESGDLVCLVKVDAEGHELRAFKVVNVHRYPLRFVTTFAFFLEPIFESW